MAAVTQVIHIYRFVVAVIQCYKNGGEGGGFKPWGVKTAALIE